MFMRSRQRCLASRLLPVAAGLVVLPILNAQPRFCGGRVAATVLVESGQVSVLKDGYPQVLNVSDSICVQQEVVTGPSSYAKFQLDDHTTIELYANSKMVFHGNSPSMLEGLFLQIGRLKIFEDHTKGENAKKVTTPTAVISVRGTIYDVVVEDDDGTTFVSVDEGAVEVRNHTAIGDGRVLLNPGDSVRVFRGQPLVPPQVAHNDIWRVALKAAQNAVYQVVYGRTNVPGMPTPGGGGTAGGGPNGDKQGKPGGGTGSGTTTGAPAPPGSGGH